MKIKLIVGLGNPTAEYEHTRHNAGFWFLDELAWQWKAVFKNEKKFFGDVARVARPEGDVWLLKPDKDDDGDNGGNNASVDILAGLDTGHDNAQTGGCHPDPRSLR